ncbi:hypothetical protein ACFL43_05065 [Thermodesulfobacteriota bacterium]
MSKDTLQRKLIPASLFLVVAVFVAFRLTAICSLPMVADEPDDYTILACDVPGVLDFFTSPKAYSHDQSRLPYLISAPFIYLLQDRALVPLRMLFFAFHLGWIFYCCRIVQLLTGSKTAVLGFLCCLVTSCYLASFSVFALTTSDSLYLFFHAAVIYYCIRSYGVLNRTGAFPDYLLLAVLLALCVASKLFGVLLLAALFVFHYCNQERYRDIRLFCRSPKRLLVCGGFFFCAIYIINRAPAAGAVKLCTALGISFAYLIYIVCAAVQERRGASADNTVNFVTFWAALVLTCFNLTLILSPTYLNLNNLLMTVTWFQDWGSGLLVARSHYYDMIIIVLMKYGLVSSAALLVLCAACAVAVIKCKKKLSRNSPYFLLLLIFVIHFVVISIVKHKVCWYPLAIFPLLYLPGAWLWSVAAKNSLKKFCAVCVLFFAVVAADNSLRYFRWFPYGHFDGAQYGREYIGWNRAGLISYEILPQLFEFLVSRGETGKVSINCQVVNVPLYNRWVSRLLQHHFSGRGQVQFSFNSRPVNRVAVTRNDYFLTSPVYYPEFETTLHRRGIEKITTLGIKEIDIVSVWRMEQVARR